MELIQYLINNFWLIFLILVFLFSDKFYLCGITLIAINVILDSNMPQWLFIIILLMAIFTAYLDPYNLWKKHYNKSLKKMKEKYEADLAWYEKELSKTEKQLAVFKAEAIEKK